MSSAKKQGLLILAAFLICLPVGLPAAYGHEGADPDAWMQNYTMFVTDAQNITEAYAAEDAITRAGGKVAIIFPNQVMLGWLPPGAGKNLVGVAKIQKIYREPVDANVRQAIVSSAASPDTRRQVLNNAVTFFNQVVNGQYKAKKVALRAQMAAAASQPIMLPDEKPQPVISQEDYLKNLTDNGISVADLEKAGISLVQPTAGAVAPSPGNSDYMVGRILFNAIFVESMGGVDANTYSWSAAMKTATQSEISAGLSWWVSTASTSSYNTPITFVYVYMQRGTSYEPIKHSSGDDYLWINQIMANNGYSSGDKFARVTAWNTAQRVSYKTNWSVTSFIGCNPPGAPSTFTDGYFAYAYIRGPYSQLLYNNDGWGAANYDIVNTHETGHLFGASDEYYQAGYGGCTYCGPVSNDVMNGNCEYCNTNAIPCMMRSNSKALCGYTPGQLGWRGVQYLNVKTYSSSTGSLKYTFAPGEGIQYKTYYCLAGPKQGTLTFPVRVRFRADYLSGALGSSGTVADDTGWAGAGSISPPTPPTTLSCYWTWWNRSVPATAGMGPANLEVQLEVGGAITYGGVADIGGLGKGAASDAVMFYTLPGAGSTASPLLSGPFAMPENGPVLEPAPVPGK